MVGILADGLPNCTTQNYSGSRYVFLGKTSIEEKKRLLLMVVILMIMMTKMTKNIQLLLTFSKKLPFSGLLLGQKKAKKYGLRWLRMILPTNYILVGGSTTRKPGQLVWPNHTPHPEFGQCPKVKTFSIDDFPWSNGQKYFFVYIIYDCIFFVYF